jgi:hypothetical protein
MGVMLLNCSGVNIGNSTFTQAMDGAGVVGLNSTYTVDNCTMSNNLFGIEL